MITYVDTSVLVKLIVDEDGSERAEIIWRSADGLAASALCTVEARAALAAAARSGRITAVQHREAKRALVGLLDVMYVIDVGDDVIASAAELAETDALRGYDAVHLAAALSVEASVMASADDALCAAAARRGLHVANPLD